jgi:hypothetical protein
MAGANKVLLDSIVAQRADGGLVVGRGVPPAWLASGSPVAVSNFPTTDGKRAAVRITAQGTSVSLVLSGARPTGPVLFQLPSFVHDIAATTSGAVDDSDGTVTLAPSVTHVTVTLRRAP